MNDSLKENKFKRDFKGVWIPKEIWLSNDLSLLEKSLLTEIHSLDNNEGCFASNEYFAKFIGFSTNKISVAISKLKKLNYIEQVSFDGRKRILKSNLDFVKNKVCLFKKQSQTFQKTKYNNTVNNTTNNTTNNNIYIEIMNAYNDSCNKYLPKCTKMTKKRQGHINSLLKEFKIEEVKEMFSKVINIPFLLGDNDKGWHIDFEWLINPNNALKVIEGRYDTLEVNNDIKETSKIHSTGKYNHLS